MVNIQKDNDNKILLTEFNDMIIICRENYRRYNLRQRNLSLTAPLYEAKTT